MRKFGLIGYPLSHSFSKKYFEEKFRREDIGGCTYDIFPIPSIKKLPDLLQSDKTLTGLNVTIPYKETAIPYLDELDDVAREIGAVNCLNKEDKKWKGYNTDYIGFKTSLLHLIGEPGKVEQAFVLGTGGAARAACYVLKGLNIPFVVVSREPEGDSIAYMDIAQRMKGANLFINATPLGMYPNPASAPALPYERMGSNDFLFDLVYNPAETWFLNKGRGRGARTINGMEMLEVQAEESWKIWNR